MLSRIFGVLLVLALLAAGCAASGSQETGPTAGADGGDAPQELRLAIGGEPEDGFDPTLGWGAYGSPLFQSTLLVRNADLEVNNDLATGYTVSDDGLTWTVTLRDDVTFTDGQPLTAEDVAYTFNTAAGTGSLVDLDVLEEAVAVDPVTVEFSLKRPQSTFVSRLVSLGIVPQHAHGEDYGRNPIGSGPFVFERWDEGQQVIAVRNPDYHGQMPSFERLVLVFAGEDTTLAAARAGQVHMASVPPAMAGEDVPGMRLEAVQTVDNRGMSFPIPANTGQLDANGNPIGNDVTADLAIRRAVNYAVDRQALVDGVLSGYGTPAYGPVDGLPWFEPESVIQDADPARAAQILSEAGWVEGSDGVRVKDGLRAEFELVYPASDSLRQGLAVAVADMLAPVGIDVTPRGASWDEIYTLRSSTPVMFGWGSHDPQEMYNLYHSSRAHTDDSYNAGYFSDPHVDAALDAALTAPDEASALPHWRAAQLDGEGRGFTTKGQAAWAWLVNIDHTYLVHECLDLGDLQIEPHGHGWPITTGITAWQWTC